MPSPLITAIATPPGTGGIGIIRLSGATLTPALPLLSPSTLPPPRQAARRKFIDTEGTTIDEGIALYFPAPNSFTGEEVLELHAHGGAVLLQRLLTRCLQCGARMAAPGEFTLRAYLNEKLDLTQAEALSDLINANSTAAARAAARALAGEFSAAVNAVQTQLRQIRIHIESDLDFSEEDTNPPDPTTITTQLTQAATALQTLLQQAQQGARLNSGADIVLAGAPNVGKSSLLNALAKEDAAIVSTTPGTTRDPVERQVEIDGLQLRVTDTAGLREAPAEVEQEGIRRAQKRLAQADVVLHLSAPDIAPPPLPAVSATVIKVENKIDLSGKPAGMQGGICHISAKTGEGILALRAALCAAINYTPQESSYTARTRHIAALQKAQTHLTQATKETAPELQAAWLKDADTHLQTITGTYTEEDLLGEIFSTFCIGK